MAAVRSPKAIPIPQSGKQTLDLVLDTVKTAYNPATDLHTQFSWEELAGIVVTIVGKVVGALDAICVFHTSAGQPVKVCDGFDVACHPERCHCCSRFVSPHAKLTPAHRTTKMLHRLSACRVHRTARVRKWRMLQLCFSLRDDFSTAPYGRGSVRGLWPIACAVSPGALTRKIAIPKAQATIKACGR